jgi:hypothetical protein
MIEILEQTQGNVIATKASGKLSAEDYAQLLPIMESVLKTHPKFRWYFEMENFKGWEFEAFWDDLKFDIKHFNNFEKVAMVGDSTWEKWITQLMKPFTKAEVKYFSLSQKQEALDWIKQ